MIVVENLSCKICNIGLCIYIASCSVIVLSLVGSRTSLEKIIEESCWVRSRRRLTEASKRIRCYETFPLNSDLGVEERLKWSAANAEGRKNECSQCIPCLEVRCDGNN